MIGRIKRYYLRGQSMFELLTAVSITALILMALISLSTVSVRNTTTSTDASVANRFAQEAVEFVRNERDTSGWDTFASTYTSIGGTQYCVDNSPPDWSSPGSCASTNYISGTIYRRDLVLTKRSVEEAVDYTVTVSWDTAQGEKYATISSTLTDWRK